MMTFSCGAKEGVSKQQTFEVQFSSHNNGPERGADVLFGWYRRDFKSKQTESHSEELKQTSCQLFWKSVQQEKQTATVKLSDWC